MRGADEALLAAQERLEWAASIGGDRWNANEYRLAQRVFREARTARSRGNFEDAQERAARVLSILAVMQPLPAQYLVSTWSAMRDCLWNIAAQPQIYGDPLKWTVIFEANRDRLSNPDNPDLIHPGMLLDIPSIRGEMRSGVWDEASNQLVSR
jgi:nucleoid-associated protein YgaU